MRFANKKEFDNIIQAAINGEECKYVDIYSAFKKREKIFTFVLLYLTYLNISNAQGDLLVIVYLLKNVNKNHEMIGAYCRRQQQQ
jgi:hypothetical protein